MNGYENGIGFIPEEVASSINSVQEAYNGLINVLSDDIQNKFVNEMANIWGCPEAKKYFANFEQRITNLIIECTKTFGSVIGTMNWSAEQYGNLTGAGYSRTEFVASNKTVDVSNIGDRVGEVIGFTDSNRARTVATDLTNIPNSAYVELESAQNAVVKCGFVAEGERSTLLNSLTNIKETINSTFMELTKLTNQAIDETVSIYESTSSNISEHMQVHSN